MVNCMPTMPDGLQLSVPEERDFFELLGVEWVEPKDRIDRKAVKVIP
jgi:DNA polymerase/3'-5' exonuclease PolX